MTAGNGPGTPPRVRGLRWTLALVVLAESGGFALSPASLRHLAQMGLPGWLAPVLGGAEMLAALLFLLPRWSRAGGYLLLSIFALAATLHLLHRQFEIGPLLVYGAAVVVCLPAAAPGPAGGAR